MEVVGNYVGQATAAAIEEILTEAWEAGASGLATWVGLGVLLFAASTVFHQVYEALNTIFRSPLFQRRGILNFIIGRSIGMLFVIGAALLIMATLAVGAALAAMTQLGEGVVPRGLGLYRLLDLAATAAIVWMVFAASYRLVPTVRPAAFGVWIGAAVAAVLFTLFKQLFAFYLGVTNPGNVYGAAGSVVVLLLWVYIVAMIFLVGAVLAKVINRQRRGEDDGRKDAR